MDQRDDEDDDDEDEDEDEEEDGAEDSVCACVCACVCVDLSNNAGLPNGGDWLSFCGSNQGACGVSGSDISVSITAPATYQKYASTVFTITAKNVGTSTDQNVQIKFTQPNFTSGVGQATASAGTYQDYCAGGVRCQTWTIPSLAAGASATLTLSVFVLDPAGASITGNASLISTTPADNNPANDMSSAVVTASGGGDPCLNDTQPPVFTNCPADISLTTTTTSATATWAPGTRLTRASANGKP